MSTFYELLDEYVLDGRCYFAGLREAEVGVCNPDHFVRGESVDTKTPLTISIREGSIPLDFSLADFDVPVLTARAAKVLGSIAGDSIQLLRARSEVGGEDLFVMNVLRIVECLDEGRSEFAKWKLDDHRPDKMGQYRQVSRLRVDPRRARGQVILRVAGWRTAIVVSKVVKDAFEMAGLIGGTFVPAIDGVG
ncbi:MAG: hypothetical protein F9K16_05110 [Thermoanaerobaculia bacterium]|nr:MAG: hypothetical protein F9K16_05110 [Thermoanaerobaculia bacterium]